MTVGQRYFRYKNRDYTIPICDVDSFIEGHPNAQEMVLFCNGGENPVVIPLVEMYAFMTGHPNAWPYYGSDSPYYYEVLIRQRPKEIPNTEGPDYKIRAAGGFEYELTSGKVICNIDLMPPQKS